MRALAYPVQVRFTDIPSDWQIATALAYSSGEFTAENYDRLVDSPVEIGTFQESDFDEGGGHYRVVVDADPDRLRHPDNRRHTAAVWSLRPPPGWMTALFKAFCSSIIFRAAPRAAAWSTAILRPSTSVPAGLPRVHWCSRDLTAHEFFHLWNVKRIRPQSLEPIDYTKENYSRALWFSEGVTTTAGNIILLRAGLLDEARYLKGLAAEIAELERRPAHLTQSAEESSLDAWLEKYDYYRLPVRSISYYNKGYLLGVLLDLQVREASKGSASLRDVLRWMNLNYARKGQPFPDSEGVRHAAELVSHADLGWFFQKYVAGTDEIPWDDFFKTVGLRLVERENSVADLGFVAVRNFDVSPVVAQVAPGSEAESAGLEVGDVILEIDGRIATSDFEQRLAALHPGNKLQLRVRNSRGEHELHWKLVRQKQIDFDLVDRENVTPQQKSSARSLASRRV